MARFITPVLLAALALAAPAAGQPPVKDGYVKVRVEVEARGVLKADGAGFVLLTRFPYYDQRDDSKVRPEPEGVPPMRVTLDFARAKELRDLAKVLDGKDVVVTGMSELRQVVPPPPPPGGGTGFTGGMPPPFGFYHFPGPSWSLQRTVLVTALRTPGKE